ncbi:MAG: hypothetical protein KDD35_05210, partial [Bdellovibrionales bacterium]|nr:hypothetical protein [Bdellovibrionales bacterium]
CPSDLDGSEPRPDQKADGCTPALGMDPEMDRYNAIKEWLDDLEAQPNLEEDGVRVVLVPFSGGKHSRPLSSEDPELYEFGTIDEARVRLNRLIQEQRDEMDLLVKDFPMTRTPPEAIHMGTTAPRSTIDYMLPVIRSEMVKLENQEQDTTNQTEPPAFTPFKVIYISDGVFRPLKEHWDKVWKFSGCDRNPNFTLCYDLKRDFRDEIGDVDSNTFDNTLTSLKNIYDLRKNFERSSLELHFVKIHPDRLLPEDQNSGKDTRLYSNLFNEIKTSLEENEGEIKIHNQFNEHRPFSLFGGPTVKTYKIDNFYVINLNRFVDDFGRVVQDSDGDGLSDEEEEKVGTSPLKARSNDICLDIITQLYGCKNVGCDPERDLDGDGLNSCEEITLSSDDSKIDSDDDGILDSHEIVRKMSPTLDSQNRFSSTDSISDYEHLKRGVSIFANIQNIPEKSMIDYSIEEVGFLKAKDNLGQELRLAEYEASIRNIPIGSSQSTSGFRSFVDSLGLAHDPKIYSLGSDHEENKNQIIHVMRVRALQDPTDVYWLIYRAEVAWEVESIRSEYQLDLSMFGHLK